MLILSGNKVTHLALHKEYQLDFLERHFLDSPRPLIPAMPHPKAALSFASILLWLRSVFCVIGFRGSERWTSETMVNYHFAQIFPLCRRGSPTGDFDWLESDPRLGVQHDLGEVAFSTNPCFLAPAWAQLEKEFGVEKTDTNTDTFSFYICPTIPYHGKDCRRQGPRSSVHLRAHGRNWRSTCVMRRSTVTGRAITFLAASMGAGKDRGTV